MEFLGAFFIHVVLYGLFVVGMKTVFNAPYISWPVISGTVIYYFTGMIFTAIASPVYSLIRNKKPLGCLASIPWCFTLLAILFDFIFHPPNIAAFTRKHFNPTSASYDVHDNSGGENYETFDSES